MQKVEYDYTETALPPIGGKSYLMKEECFGNSLDTYKPPMSQSASKRWKRIHEQSMMLHLDEMHIIKKQNAQMSKEAARKVIRKIPVEVLAKEWLSKEDATVDMRAYLVDNVLPTLILGIERLLKEVDEKQLASRKTSEPDFNPVNFLAQYLMRNNPRFSNFAEASPYVRGLRQVSEELKQELFTFEDNRLARIKAEARRKRSEREKIEQLQKEEKERRQQKLVTHFKEWNVPTDNNRVELSLLQNALMSFAEMAAQLPEELREVAKFGHPLEPVDETGRTLAVKEFAQYISLFVEDLPGEVFEQFMVHMSKCAAAHRAAAERENRRILLTNLFIVCDHGGMGLLARHRILLLFEQFWDMLKDAKIETGTLRNPRKWPVVEVNEVDDIFSDKWDEEEGGIFEGDQETVIQQLTIINQDLRRQVKEAAEHDEAGKERMKKELLEQREKEQEKETSSKEEEITTQETEEEKEEAVKNPEDSEVEKEVQDQDENAVQGEQGDADQENKDSELQDAKTENEDDKTEKKDEEQKKISETDDGKGESSGMEEKVEEVDPQRTSDDVPVDSADGKGEESKKDDGELEENKRAESVAKTNEEFDVDITGEIDASQSKSALKQTDLTNPATATGRISVTFAGNTAFDTEKTGLTAGHSRTHSRMSVFDESILNVSQFVQLTETYLGHHPKEILFDRLIKYLRDGYEETEEEKTDRLIKARKEAINAKRRMMLDNLFDKWDNDGCGYLEMDDVQDVMFKYKDGQEIQMIKKAQNSLARQSKFHDQRLSRREFRRFVDLVVEQLPGLESFEFFVDFMINSVERSYAERIRGEARKKWLSQIVAASLICGTGLDQVYNAVFHALYKDAEAHGGEKKISAFISMLEKNITEPERGELCLRYAACTQEDCQYVLGKILYQNMRGISWNAVESGKPVHVPRVANHGNILFWNYDRLPEDREGSFIVVPLKDNKKRVFGLLGLDTMLDTQKKSIFITHEIQFFQGVAKNFSVAYHIIDVRRKLLRITESAISWIQRRCPHISTISVYIVEPNTKSDKELVLRKMMTTDAKGAAIRVVETFRMERKDNLFRDYLFKCMDTSETITADAYGERHTASPLRDMEGKAIGVVDISIGQLKRLPNYENKEAQRMLRLLQKAYKEITQEADGKDTTRVLDAEKDDDSRMEIMFDRLMLMELRDNVSRLDPRAFAELKSYNDPPQIIHDILRATMTIFKAQKAIEGVFEDWNVLKAHITPDLIQQIKTYDPTVVTNPVDTDAVENYLKAVPHGAVAKHGSIPAQQLYNWVFVCVSLIEHTRKMRENAGGNVGVTVEKTPTSNKVDGKH